MGVHHAAVLNDGSKFSKATTVASMPTVEISDSNDEVLSFDLADILAVLEPFARNLEWYIVELDPMVLLGANDPKPAVKSWVLELLKQIKVSSSPVKLSWEMLSDLSRNIVQTEMGLLFAIEPSGEVPNQPFDLNSDKFEVVIQGVDTSFWAVTTRKNNIVDQLKQRFREVEIVASTRTYY